MNITLIFNAIVITFIQLFPIINAIHITSKSSNFILYL